MKAFEAVYYSYSGFDERGLKGSCFVSMEGKDLFLTCIGLIPRLMKYTPLILTGIPDEENGEFLISDIKINESDIASARFLSQAKLCKPKDYDVLKSVLPSGLWSLTVRDRDLLTENDIPEYAADAMINAVCVTKDASLSIKYMSAAGFSFENMHLFFLRGHRFEELRKNIYRIGTLCRVSLTVCDKAAFLEEERKKQEKDPFAFFDINSKARADFCIRRAASMIENKGHTFVYLSELEKTLRLASRSKSADPPNPDLLTLRALNSPAFTVSGEKIYITRYLERETRVVRNLFRIEEKDLPHVPVSEMQENFMKKFDESQKAAVYGSLQSKISIITGGPGTGKTTITKVIVGCCEDFGLRVLLCAPTGRAASMMKGKTKHDASTIHRMLGIHGITEDKYVAEFDAKKHLPCDVLIVDESSMVDITVFDMLLCAVPDECRIIFIGDADQLPSVSPGDILRNLIKSGRYPVFRLETTHRQIDGSVIIENAKNVMSGDDLKEGPDFEIKEFDDETSMQKAVLSDFAAYYNLKNPDSFQILSPVKGGVCGTETLNNEAVLLLRPSDNRRFAEGDKVMTIKNVYGSSKETSYINGDVGTVKEIKKGNAELKILDGGRVLVGDLADLRHAYAITIHKSQGSEYDTAAIVIGKSGGRMLTKQLLYTAVTRARKNVIIYRLKDADAPKDMPKRNCAIAENLKKRSAQT